MTDKTQSLSRLIALLDEQEKAKTVSHKEDNPYHNRSLEEINQGVPGDNIPAINMATKVDVKINKESDVPHMEQVHEQTMASAGHALESGRIVAAASGREDKSRRRMAVARARAARKIEFDQIADAKVKVKPERMDQAWRVVFHMVPIVTKIAKGKQRWANRLLGSNADDIPQMTLETMAKVLAKQQKWDLDLLNRAAEQMAARERGIPGNQVFRETDSDEVKQLKRARKWLMGLVNNRVRGALVDSYTSTHNLRWDNLDVIATVMASISGKGDDPMLDRFKADRAPAFMGTRFPAPGSIDGNLLAVAITGAITERGLDPMTEFLLDEEHINTNGSVQWSKYSREIFLLTPGGDGPWMWDLVVQATAEMDRRRKARADAARAHVRNLFAWMPGLITEAVRSFDPHFLYWSSNDGRAVMASDFELYYLPESSAARKPLVPKLMYATVEDAAAALQEHLAHLTTGSDVVKAIVNS